MAYIGASPPASALTASDISDGIISNAKLAQDIISADTALGAEPADTDELLVSDAGTLKRMDYSHIKASGGLSTASQWRVTADFAGVTDPITANWEEVDTSGMGVLGSSMTQSSGIFTFPSTGYWLVSFHNSLVSTGDSNTQESEIQATINDSSYITMSEAWAGGKETNEVGFGFQQIIMDVTDVANVKVKFAIVALDTAAYITNRGNTDQNETYAQFLKIGAT